MPSPILYQLDDGQTRLYVVSDRLPAEYIRQIFHTKDHGGLSYEEFESCYLNGAVTEIWSLDQVPDDDLDWVPYIACDIEDRLWNEFDYYTDICEWLGICLRHLENKDVQILPAEDTSPDHP